MEGRALDTLRISQEISLVLEYQGKKRKGRILSSQKPRAKVHSRLYRRLVEKEHGSFPHQWVKE